jgi:hypothetical protein
MGVVWSILVKVIPGRNGDEAIGKSSRGGEAAEKQGKNQRESEKNNPGKRRDNIYKPERDRETQKRTNWIETNNQPKEQFLIQF